jgi:hypothetical protein
VGGYFFGGWWEAGGAFEQSFELSLLRNAQRRNKRDQKKLCVFGFSLWAFLAAGGLKILKHYFFYFLAEN